MAGRHPAMEVSLKPQTVQEKQLKKAEPDTFLLEWQQ